MHAHRRRTSTSLGLIAVVCLVIGTVSTIDSIPGAGELHAQTSWRGLVVAPEQRCSPYDVDDCRYPQSVEDRIVDELGEVYGPYTGRWFASTSDTAIGTWWLVPRRTTAVCAPRTLRPGAASRPTC